MHTYALTLDFDVDIESTIFELWERLQVEGISDYGFAHEGKAPHITLADFEHIELAILEQELQMFCSSHGAFLIQFDQINRFAANRTLYLAVSDSQALFELHKALLRDVKSIKLLEHSYCSNEKWQPHLTLVSRLDADKMETVQDYIQEKLPLTGWVTGISLLKLHENEQGRVIGQEVIDRFLFKC